MPYLEAEVFFHGVKGCSRGDTQSTRAAHIVRLQPEPRYRVVPVVGPPRGAAGRRDTWWDMRWDVLGDAGEGVGVSQRQRPPIPRRVWDLLVQEADAGGGSCGFAALPSRR